MVSDSVIISLYTLGVAVITFPIMFAVLYKIRTKIKFSPFLLGILVYFTFSLVCTTFVHSIFLNQNRPTHTFLESNALVYSLYQAVVVGLCDQLGMFVAFKKLMLTHDDKRTSIMYALGHAGADLFILCFFSVITYILWATTLNAKGVEGFLEIYGDAKYSDAEAAIEYIQSFSVGQVLLMAFERILYFLMYIGLSMISFYAAKRGPKSYFWIGVALRGLCSVPGSLEKFSEKYSEGLNLVFMLFYLIIMVAITLLIAFRLYRSYDTEEVLMPGNLFKKMNKNL